MSTAETQPEPDHLEEAATALRRIAWFAKLLEKHRENAKQQETRLVERISYYETFLEHHGRTLSRQYGKSDVTLPGGHCWTRKAKGSFMVHDAAKLLAWAKERSLTRLQPAVEMVPTMTVIRENLIDSKDGLMDTVTGEIVDWASIVKPEDGLAFGYALDKDVKEEPEPDDEVME